jgi:predicted metal-binding protein
VADCHAPANQGFSYSPVFAWNAEIASALAPRRELRVKSAPTMSNDASGAVHASLATKADLLCHHDPERVQGYCHGCEKYGRFWSCPPFTAPPLASFPEWTHAVIVCQRIWLEPGTTRTQLIERFLAARVGFGERIRRLEGREARVTGLVAGHCPGCTDCTRSEGKACRAPERMRHSLEAVGFDVTALVGALTGLRLHWPKSGVPDYLTTVGALLCPEEAVAARLREAAGETDGCVAR